MLVVISLSMMVLIIWAELESSGLTTCAWFSRPTAFSVRYFSTWYGRYGAADSVLSETKTTGALKLPEELKIFSAGLWTPSMY